MNHSKTPAPAGSRIALGCGAIAGVVALLHPAADYVADNSPNWFVPAGIAVAVASRMLARTTSQRYTGLLIATALLLPAACTLLLLHLLRLVGAIPLPLDPASAVVSVGAALALCSLWFLPNPLRPRRGLRLPVPGWVPVAGIAASLVYPTLKILWALGIDIAAPSDTVGVVDATFFATVAVSLAAAPALAIAMRWWDRPAPGWVRPVALAGGFVLVSLGVSGSWAVATGPGEGVATGLLVYGGWLLWGAAVLATAGRLAPETPKGVPADERLDGDAREGPRADRRDPIRKEALEAP